MGFNTGLSNVFRTRKFDEDEHADWHHTTLETMHCVGGLAHFKMIERLYDDGRRVARFANFCACDSSCGKDRRRIRPQCVLVVPEAARQIEALLH